MTIIFVSKSNVFPPRCSNMISSPSIVHIIFTDGLIGSGLSVRTEK